MLSGGSGCVMGSKMWSLIAGLHLQRNANAKYNNKLENVSVQLLLLALWAYTDI